MQCPIDGTVLSVSTREGVEIDFCPSCRGVWLDRGELDKIIERTNDAYGDAAPRRESRHDDTPPQGTAAPKRKKKSFLENIFEFGGD